jgi:hypothetical protein
MPLRDDYGVGVFGRAATDLQPEHLQRYDMRRRPVLYLFVQLRGLQADVQQLRARP